MSEDRNKPKWAKTFEDSDGYEDGRKLIRIFFGCPTCDESYLMPGEKRCPKCGQALKW